MNGPWKLVLMYNCLPISNVLFIIKSVFGQVVVVVTVSPQPLHQYYGFAPQWTIQRNWQHWVHKPQDKDKQNKIKHCYMQASTVLLLWSVLLIIFVVSHYVSYVLSSMLWCPLRFQHKNNVRFVFSSSCLQEGSCLIYVTCVCLRIVMFKTYCVVFLFSLSTSCVHYVANFYGWSIFEFSSGFL